MLLNSLAKSRKAEKESLAVGFGYALQYISPALSATARR
jgi:hypothetical protein